MYKVLKKFEDTDGKNYEVGDEYKGSLEKDRLDTLSTKENKYSLVFIEEVKPKTPKKVAKKNDKQD